jgi:hypothetical protein
MYIYIYMYVYMYIFNYIYIHIHTDTHSHTHRRINIDNVPSPGCSGQICICAFLPTHDSTRDMKSFNENGLPLPKFIT